MDSKITHAAAFLGLAIGPFLPWQNIFAEVPSEVPSYEAEYRSVDPDGRLIAEDLFGRQADGTEVLRMVIHTGGKLWPERTIIDYAGQRLYAVHDGAGVVTALRHSGLPVTPPYLSDPDQDCVVNYNGIRDERQRVLRHESVLGHKAVVVAESSSIGPDTTVWYALDFHCIALKIEARYGDRLLSTKEMTALRTKTTPNLYRIPEKFDRVDPIEYFQRGGIYHGKSPEAAAAHAQEAAAPELPNYVSGFQIPERLTIKECE